MNEAKVFCSDQFGEIRATEIDGKPWFVGCDVAEALGYSNPGLAVLDIVDDEDMRNERIGRLINVSGLYSLVFQSKTASAKRFKRWVAGEVLPAFKGSRPLSQLEIAKMSIEMLIEQENRINEQGDRITAVEEDIRKLSAKVETRQGSWYSVAGYAMLNDIHLKLEMAQACGIKATKLSRERGYEISTTPDPRFGKVNVYHTDILKEVFKDYM